MSETPRLDLPVEIPEADLLEQRLTVEAPESPAGEIGAGLVEPAVTEILADEGDVLEQAAEVPGDDDDSYSRG